MDGLGSGHIARRIVSMAAAALSRILQPKYMVFWAPARDQNAGIPLQEYRSSDAK
jgi:hypothetical protein